MYKIAKNSWIPISVSLPDTNRTVAIQLLDYLEPSIGCFQNGEWEIMDKTICNAEAPVIAWREMFERYEPADTDIVFRTANETRLLTIAAINRAAQPNYDSEFYMIRDKVLHAAVIDKKFETTFKELSAKNAVRLSHAGFKISSASDLNGEYYIVSWRE